VAHEASTTTFIFAKNLINIVEIFDRAKWVDWPVGQLALLPSFEICDDLNDPRGLFEFTKRFALRPSEWGAVLQSIFFILLGLLKCIRVAFF